jgi:hypothetical protein
MVRGVWNMKITKINRDVCKQLRVDMNEAIRSKLEEYGLEGEFLNGSFDDELVTFKVDIKIAGAMDKRDKQLSNSLSWYVKYLEITFELDEDLILNEEYESHGGKYKLVGYNSKAKTYPLIMEDMESRKKYKFRESVVKDTLSRRVA